MKNKKYIKIRFNSIASFVAENRAYPIGSIGQFVSIINIRSKETKIIEGFYGSTYIFEEEWIERLQKAINAMMEALKKSDTFRAGNYEVRNHLTGKWEQVKL